VASTLLPELAQGAPLVLAQLLETGDEVGGQSPAGGAVARQLVGQVHYVAVERELSGQDEPVHIHRFRPPSIPMASHAGGRLSQPGVLSGT
jgi:hypothetical protein